MNKVYDKPCAKHYPDFCEYCAAKQRGCEYAEEQIPLPTTPPRTVPFVCVVGEEYKTITNPNTNRSIVLPPDAVAVWNVIIRGEEFNQYKENILEDDLFFHNILNRIESNNII